MSNRWGNSWNKLKELAPWKKCYDQPREHIKKQRHYFANKCSSSQSYSFSRSHVWMWELDHKESLSTEEWMLLNCDVGEDSWESLGLQGDPTSPSWRRSVLNSYWKNWCWNSNTLATWWEELTHWKRPWCWERLKVRGEGDNGGGDGWMASPAQWTWIWASSGSWWRTAKLGVLLCGWKESDVTEWLNWTEVNRLSVIFI